MSACQVYVHTCGQYCRSRGASHHSTEERKMIRGERIPLTRYSAATIHLSNPFSYIQHSTLHYSPIPLLEGKDSTVQQIIRTHRVVPYYCHSFPFSHSPSLQLESTIQSQSINNNIFHNHAHARTQRSKNRCTLRCSFTVCTFSYLFRPMFFFPCFMETNGT